MSYGMSFEESKKSLSIASIRREYSLAGLRRKDLDPDPTRQFQKWFQEALDVQQLEPNAMTLATADKEGRPSARTVLLRCADEKGFAFYTNYESRKGRELALNPHAALVFFWAQIERQVCITGKVSRLSLPESKKYYVSRPAGSRLAAWVSKQSEVIPNREVLDDGLKKVTAQYLDKEIPMPDYWGGFILMPQTIEFWQGRPNRLHDRFQYRKEKGGWVIERLSP
jgi:pyridoxamine 5'-phosphate oxidase